MATRTRRTRAPQRVTLRAGPFLGMHDNPYALEEPDPRLALELINVQPPLDPSRPGVWQRYGFTRHLSALGSTTRIQGIVQHTASDGTERTFIAAGGVIYRVTWAASPIMATTVVTPAGPTISSTARFIYMVPFGDQLIVSDGVNKPWRGTTLGATPILGTNIEVDTAATAWAAYGPPTVYYAKLFFVRNNDRTRIVWSEELDPAIGYEQNTYSNYWSLIQSGQGAITRLFGTNAALYYFRANSIGAIYGAVEDDFQSSGTHDNISTGLGTVSPLSVVLRGSDLVFHAHGQRPYRLPPGGRPVPLYEPIAVGLDRASAYIIRSGWTIYFASLDLMLMNMPGYPGALPSITAGASEAVSYELGDTLAAFFGDRSYGAWNVVNTSIGAYGAVVINAQTGRPVILIGDNFGGIWEYTQGYADTDPSGTTLRPAVTVRTQELGDGDAEYRFDQIAVDVAEITLLGDTGGTTAASIDYRTSRGTYGTPQTVTVPDVPNDSTGRGVVGVMGHGRWIQPRVKNSTLHASMLFSVGEIRVVAYPHDAFPTAP